MSKKKRHIIDDDDFITTRSKQPILKKHRKHREAPPLTKKKQHHQLSITDFQCRLPADIINIIYTYIEEDDTTAILDIFFKFSADQQCVVEDIFNSTDNIAIFGQGGTGKSSLIKTIRSLFRCLVLAYTGVAAAVVSGNTIDSIVRSPSSFFEMFELIIIDEISMVTSMKIRQLQEKIPNKRFLLLGDLLQLPPVYEFAKQPTPLQPNFPMRQRLLLDNFEGIDYMNNNAFFCFENEIFKNIICRKLTTNFRQDKEQVILRDVLQVVRRGCFNWQKVPTLVSFIQSRFKAYQDMDADDRNTITHLFTDNRRVDLHNEKIFQLLAPETEQTYKPTFLHKLRLFRNGDIIEKICNIPGPAVLQPLRQEIAAFTKVSDYNSCLKNDVLVDYPKAKQIIEAYAKLSSTAKSLLLARYTPVYMDIPAYVMDDLDVVDLMKKSTKIENKQKNVTIRTGQTVIVTKNSKSDEIFNGMQGHIISADNISVNLEISNSPDVTVKKKKIYTAMHVKSKSHTFCVYLESTIMPLLGANAMTIHRAQGLTLKRVIIFLDTVSSYQPAISYVAISRVCCADGLFFGALPKNTAFHSHYDCVTFNNNVIYNKLANSSMRAMQQCWVCKKIYSRIWKNFICCKK